MSTFEPQFRSQESVSTVEISSSLTKSRLLAQLGGIDVASGIVYIRLVDEIAQKHQHAQRRVYKIKSSLELTLYSSVGQTEVESQEHKAKKRRFLGRREKRRVVDTHWVGKGAKSRTAPCSLTSVFRSRRHTRANTRQFQRARPGGRFRFFFFCSFLFFDTSAGRASTISPIPFLTSPPSPAHHECQSGRAHSAVAQAGAGEGHNRRGCDNCIRTTGHSLDRAHPES